jgi:hypothetical protein
MHNRESEIKDETPSFDKSRKSQETTPLLDLDSILSNEEPRELSQNLRAIFHQAKNEN